MKIAIALEDLNPAVRFYFDDDNRESGWVELRALNGGAADDINKKWSKKKVEYRVNPQTRRNERIEFVEVDADGAFREVTDYNIADWNIPDAKTGEPIPCTTDMKVTLMRGSPEFAQFVTKSLDTLRVDEAAVAVEVEKNS